MKVPEPFITLFDEAAGEALPLPPELAAIYGPLRLSTRTDRPTTLANFVSSLDGVVSLGIPGQSGGKPISGNDAHDRLLMGLLRATADAVIVGAGTVRAVSPRHVWTPDHVFPELAPAWGAFRAALGKPEPPLNVVVTASGDLDLGLRVFASGVAPVLIVTTARGAEHLCHLARPPWVRVADVQCAGTIGAEAILAAVSQERPSRVVLLEGGPHLLGDFLAAGCLDDLFLTLAPQVAGRAEGDRRPALVEGWRFAPEHPLWSTLVSARRAGSHLFLRYAGETNPVTGPGE